MRHIVHVGLNSDISLFNKPTAYSKIWSCLYLYQVNESYLKLTGKSIYLLTLGALGDIEAIAPFKMVDYRLVEKMFA